MSSFVQAIDILVQSLTGEKLSRIQSAENAGRLTEVSRYVTGSMRGCCESADFSFGRLVELLQGRVPTHMPPEDVTSERYARFQAFAVSTAVAFECLATIQDDILERSLRESVKWKTDPGKGDWKSRSDRVPFRFSGRAYDTNRLGVRTIEEMRNQVAHTGPYVYDKPILEPSPVILADVGISQFADTFLKHLVQRIAEKEIKSPEDLLNKLGCSGMAFLLQVTQSLQSTAVRYVGSVAAGLAAACPGLLSA